MYEKFEIMGIRPQQLSSPGSANPADARAVDRGETKWVEDRWSLAGHECRPYVSPNGPAGSAEGNPTATGQWLAGGECGENKS